MIRLDSKGFEKFIEELAGAYTLFAPVMKGGKQVFGVISSAEDIDASRLNTERSPKEIFFPHSEVLFEYDENGIRTAGGEEKPIAVWGMREAFRCSIRCSAARARGLPTFVSTTHTGVGVTTSH